ncbi:efflux RND transporter periplasmic adaptor subunit [Geobacter argillaceus]|uniref:Multidrug efflux pump subunit AcrA (Membrane-fusion protein) n=1 Tax=Geobacter argillaceus TaxID=345631 RepID=A0A562V606_9BACT|nr:efflux RND transporter periplasmic adaptor subunit [Geobacter argillaceus]TWJ13320.1 multidrug efflux pump subunit AcrA (membrane-fusion protein) [Geobacter argillaceus]
MKRASKLALFVLILGCLAALLVWAFLEQRGELAREKERDQPIKPPMRVVSTERGNLVVLGKTTMAKSGIRVEPLKETAQYGEVTAYGSVVDIRELLDWLESYAKAEGVLEKSRAELEVSQNEYLRLKGLHDDSHNVSDKALQAAEGVWRSGKAQVRADEASTGNLRSIARQHWGIVITGWLVERNTNIDRLIRQERALIQITVPPGTSLPSPPRSIRIKGATSTPRGAVLVSPSPRMNPNIQGFSYYYLASTERESLLPGMNITASLPVGTKMKGVYIPSSAVVWWQGKAWIYLQRNEEQFERMEIPTEHAVQDGFFAANSLSRSDRVVVTGAQLLLSEELRSQIKIGG